jgi:hypothetical protein
MAAWRGGAAAQGGTPGPRSWGPWAGTPGDGRATMLGPGRFPDRPGQCRLAPMAPMAGAGDPGWPGRSGPGRWAKPARPWPRAGLVMSGPKFEDGRLGEGRQSQEELEPWGDEAPRRGVASGCRRPGMAGRRMPGDWPARGGVLRWVGRPVSPSPRARRPWRGLQAAVPCPPRRPFPPALPARRPKSSPAACPRPLAAGSPGAAFWCDPLVRWMASRGPRPPLVSLAQDDAWRAGNPGWLGFHRPRLEANGVWAKALSATSDVAPWPSVVREHLASPWPDSCDRTGKFASDMKSL